MRYRIPIALGITCVAAMTLVGATMTIIHLMPNDQNTTGGSYDFTD